MTPEHRTQTGAAELRSPHSGVNLYAPETGAADPAADPLLPESAAAVVLGGDKPLSVKTLQGWRVSGHGPRFVKLGSGLRAAVRYRRSELLRFLADCERGSTAEHSAKGAGA